MLSTITTTIRKHKIALIAAGAAFFLGALALFGALKASPALSAMLFERPPSWESKTPGKGMAWLQPSPPRMPSVPQIPDDEERAAREAMDEAEQQMQALQRRFFGGRDPFEEARRMHEDMRKGLVGGGLIALEAGGENIVEREDDKAVYFEISGVDQTKLSTRVEGGMLTIEGQARQEKGAGGFQAMVHSSFQRSFSLPPNVDEKGMEISSVGDKIVLKFPKRS
jgi:HSP20 family molecular chaperone IbpA